MSDIIQKIKLLQNVAPNPEWKKSNREFLMRTIKSDFDELKTRRIMWARELVKIFSPWRMAKYAYRPALAIISIFGLVLGSVFSVSASQMSLPGDALYPLKIATEKMQVALTFNQEEQTKMHVELAGKRVNEVKKIKETSGSAAKKIQKINIAMNKFQEEIAAVQTNLDDFKKIIPSAATIEVAKIIDNKTNEYQDDLAKTTAELPAEGEMAQKINQGLDLAGEMGDKALAMIVGEHTQAGAVLSEESKEDVLERVERRIETTEARVARVENQINGLLVGGGLSSAISPEAKQATDQTNQAKEVLAEAREALNQKEVGIALDKVLESKGLAKQAEQMAAGATALATAAESSCVENCPVADGPEVAEPADKMDDGAKITPAPMKIYKPAVKTPPAVEPVKEIDESELRVGIDLRQEESE